MIILQGKRGLGIQEFHICVILIVAEWVKWYYNMQNNICYLHIKYLVSEFVIFPQFVVNSGYIMQCWIQLCVACATLENDDTSKVSFVFHSLILPSNSSPSLHTKILPHNKTKRGRSSSQGSDLLRVSEGGGGKPLPHPLEDGQWKSPQSRVIYFWTLKCCCFSPTGDIWWEISFPLLLCPFLGEGCCGCWLVTPRSSRSCAECSMTNKAFTLSSTAMIFISAPRVVSWFGILLESSPLLLLRPKSCFFGGGSATATTIPWSAYRYQEHLTKQALLVKPELSVQSSQQGKKGAA